jgi:hypothetical protein
MADHTHPAHEYRRTYGYDCDDNGIIKNPGKFEGEMIYLPYLWEQSLDFCAPHSDGSFSVAITDKDRTLFPELTKRTVRMRESDDGFVQEV